MGGFPLMQTRVEGGCGKGFPDGVEDGQGYLHTHV